MNLFSFVLYFFFQAEDGIRDRDVTGVQTCALPISRMVLPAVTYLSFIKATSSYQNWDLSDQIALQMLETFKLLLRPSKRTQGRSFISLQSSTADYLRQSSRIHLSMLLLGMARIIRINMIWAALIPLEPSATTTQTQASLLCFQLLRIIQEPRLRIS